MSQKNLPGLIPDESRNLDLIQWLDRAPPGVLGVVVKSRDFQLLNSRIHELVRHPMEVLPPLRGYLTWMNENGDITVAEPQEFTSRMRALVSNGVEAALSKWAKGVEGEGDLL